MKELFKISPFLLYLFLSSCSFSQTNTPIPKTDLLINLTSKDTLHNEEFPRIKNEKFIATFIQAKGVGISEMEMDLDLLVYEFQQQYIFVDEKNFQKSKIGNYDALFFDGYHFNYRVIIFGDSENSFMILFQPYNEEQKISDSEISDFLKSIQVSKENDFENEKFFAPLWNYYQHSKYTSLFQPKVNLEECPSYIYKINIPFGSEANFQKNTHLVNTFFLIKKNIDSVIYLNAENKKLKLDQVSNELENFKSQFNEWEWDRHRITHSLVIDSEVKMKFVYQFFNEIQKNEFQRISLASVLIENPDSNSYSKFYRSGLSQRLPIGHCFSLKSLVEKIKKNPHQAKELVKQFEDKNPFCWLESFVTYGNEVDKGKDIYFSKSGFLFFNQQKISKSDFLIKMKNEILEKKQKAHFILKIDEDVKYGDYFWLKNEIKKAYNKARNSIAMKWFQKEFQHLSKEQKREIRSEYPKVVTELMTKEEQFIFDFFKKQIIRKGE